MTGKIKQFLLFTDTHGIPITQIKNDGTIRIDAIIHLGDFTDNNHHGRQFFESCKHIGCPVYFISGNHETQSHCIEYAKEYSATYLDYDFAISDRILFAGVGGYDLFSKLREKNIRRFSNAFQYEQEADASQFSILLSHEPPWPWKYECKVRGSYAIREFAIDHNFNLILSGHWHEETYRIEKDAQPVPVLNPGTKGCILEVEPCSGEYHVSPI